jgi:Pentapeptide repeats (8 copies)
MMTARFRSWWQKLRQHWIAIGVVGIILVVTIVLIIVGYGFGWTGFNGYTQVTIAHTISGTVTKTEVYQSGKGLWDWLNLLGVLAIPAVVGLGGAWYTVQQGKVSARENTDNQRETALQAYIDNMSELLLHEKLRESSAEDEVRKIARVRTLTILPRLDSSRKRNILQFLQESGLIVNGINKCIIDLFGADLNGANLRLTFLINANLTGAHLCGADLSEAFLSGANLNSADLRTLTEIKVPVIQGVRPPDVFAHLEEDEEYREQQAQGDTVLFVKECLQDGHLHCYTLISSSKPHSYFSYR